MDVVGGLSNVFDPIDVFNVRGNRNLSRANAALDEAQAAAQAAADQNKSLYGNYLNNVNNVYGTEAGKFGQRVSDLESITPYDAGQFDDSKYGKTVEDFYSKAANQRVNNAMNAITNSRANAGNMFSSDYTNALAAKQQALASEEWDKAFNRYQQDRSRALSEFSTNANIGQQTYNNLYNKNKDLLGISQNAQDNTLNALGAYTQGLANNNNMLAQNASNIAQAKAANAIQNNRSLLSKVFG
jgi:hypothetical protein